MSDKLTITKRKRVKGEDGYKTFSVRVKDETVKELDRLAQETGRSRNELINRFLEYGANNCEIAD